MLFIWICNVFEILHAKRTCRSIEQSSDINTVETSSSSSFNSKFFGPLFGFFFYKYIFFFLSLYSGTPFPSWIIPLIFLFLFQSFHLFELLLLITSGFPLTLNDLQKHTLSFKVFEDILSAHSEITKLLGFHH